MKLTQIEFTTAQGEKIKLSLEETRQLYGELHKLFGKEVLPTTVITKNNPFLKQSDFPADFPEHLLLGRGNT